MPINMGAAQAQARKARARQQSTGPTGAATAVDPSNLCLTPAAWAARDIPPEDKLLGSIFSTTSRSQFSADTGLGKTMFGLAVAFVIRLGVDFLHWHGQRPARVLYLDGEMPGELIKARLAAAASWFGLENPIADGLFVLSREDVDDMPPLDTPDGAAWLLDFIERLGGVDFLIADNIAALTVASLKEEEGARILKDLQRELTKRRIGQLWLHHTGHDNSRGYGPKMREWSLDVAMVGEELDRPGADVAFTRSSSQKHAAGPPTTGPISRKSRSNSATADGSAAHPRPRIKGVKGGRSAHRSASTRSRKHWPNSARHHRLVPQPSACTRQSRSSSGDRSSTAWRPTAMIKPMLGERPGRSGSRS
jgi:AAA domain